MTEKERKNHDDLFKLMQENPDLPVVPMVDADIVAGDDYGRWMGSWGERERRRIPHSPGRQADDFQERR